MNRRDLLIEMLALGAAAAAAPALAERASTSRDPLPFEPLPFESLPGPMPLPGDGRTAEQQRRLYSRLEIEDRLLVPAGYRSELLLSWGDRLADGRFGFNNDYLAFTALTATRALLTVNFEYISARSWVAGFADATGVTLPFDALRQGLAQRGGSVDVGALAPGDPLLGHLLAVATAAMADLGIGVAEICLDASGQWRQQPGRFDRRVTGLTGLNQPQQFLSGASVGDTTTVWVIGSLAALLIAPVAKPPGEPCSPQKKTSRARWSSASTPMAPLPRQRSVHSALTANA